MSKNQSLNTDCFYCPQHFTHQTLYIYSPTNNESSNHHIIYIYCTANNHSHTLYIYCPKKSLATKFITNIPQKITLHTSNTKFIYFPTTNYSQPNVNILSHNQSLTIHCISTVNTNNHAQHNVYLLSHNQSHTPHTVYQQPHN